MIKRHWSLHSISVDDTTFMKLRYFKMELMHEYIALISNSHIWKNVQPHRASYSETHVDEQAP